MMKRILFAVAPMMLLAGSVFADDDLLSSIAKLDLDGQKVTAADVESDELGQADVDALLGDDDGSSEEAIAACFRRIGYGYRYRSFNRCYSYNCYRPVYHSHCYNHCYTPTYTCYTPTYTCYTPVYNCYWGCW